MNPLARVPFCPLDVTVKVTAPALPAGDTAVISAALTTTTLVAAAVPNVTVAPETNPVPVIVTAVPPAGGPLLGETTLTVTPVTYVKPLAKLPLWPPGFVTVTLVAPAVPAGVVAVIVVLFETTTFVAAVPPNVIVAPEAKFIPVIVTAVPPAVAPLLGDKLVIVGDGVETAEIATICMTHPPAELNVALAL